MAHIVNSVPRIAWPVTLRRAGHDEDLQAQPLTTDEPYRPRTSGPGTALAASLAAAISLSRSTLPADRLQLVCFAGLALTLDGRVLVLGGYLLVRHRGRADRIALHEEMVPAESAQLEVSIQKLSESIDQNLGKALEELSNLIDKEPF